MKFKPRIFMEFDSLDSAIEYRRETGCGGWIMHYDDDKSAVIFPAGMTATPVMMHRLSKGRSGQLYC